MGLLHAYFFQKQSILLCDFHCYPEITSIHQVGILTSFQNEEHGYNIFFSHQHSLLSLLPSQWFKEMGFNREMAKVIKFSLESKSAVNNAFVY